MVLDAPRASPRRLGAPIAITPYYLYTDVEFFRAGNAESSHAPPTPNGGRAGARGVIISDAIGFLQSIIFKSDPGFH
jgi:hypothetical protein